MKVNNASLEIRPRNKWEAIDLGILLARRHLFLLLSCWSLVTLPIFILLTAIFWQVPLISFMIWQLPLLPIIIFWWLKPVFERIPLYILSNVVFGNTPTIKETLLFWLTNLVSSKTLSDLTIHRFSLSRSFNLAIKHLEGLTGSARTSRLKQLHHTKPPAKWLTFIFIHFEGILCGLFISLLFMLIPTNIYMEESTTWTDSLLTDLPFWLVHLCCALYVIVLIISESLYVSCGFCLYLNSRTLLESWDIELVFRRLAERLTNTLPSILLVVCCVFTISFASDVKAETDKANSSKMLQSDTISQTNQPTPKQLTPLELERQSSKQQINKIVKSSPFFKRQEVTHFRWKNSNQPSDQKENSSNFLFFLIGWFFSVIFTKLVWGIALFIALFILWQNRNQLIHINKPKPSSLPEHLFGLTITPDSLPSDILGVFEKHWQQGDTRQAVGLLYRALLSYLGHYYHIPLKSSHTEGEVVNLARQLPCATLITFTEQLTDQWLQLAYGHHPMSSHQKQLLIEGWQAVTTNNKEVKK